MSEVNPEGSLKYGTADKHKCGSSSSASSTSSITDAALPSTTGLNQASTESALQKSSYSKLRALASNFRENSCIPKTSGFSVLTSGDDFISFSRPIQRMPNEEQNSIQTKLSASNSTYLKSAVTNVNKSSLGAKIETKNVPILNNTSSIVTNKISDNTLHTKLSNLNQHRGSIVPALGDLVNSNTIISSTFSDLSKFGEGSTISKDKSLTTNSTASRGLVSGAANHNTKNSAVTVFSTTVKPQTIKSTQLSQIVTRSTSVHITSKEIKPQVSVRNRTVAVYSNNNPQPLNMSVNISTSKQLNSPASTKSANQNFRSSGNLQTHPVIFSSQYSLVKQNSTLINPAAYNRNQSVNVSRFTYSKPKQPAIPLSSPKAFQNVQLRNGKFSRAAGSLRKMNPYRWSSQRGIKKGNTSTGFTDVKNMSRNRYKFISASALKQSTPRQRLQAWNKMSRFGVGKRQWSPGASGVTFSPVAAFNVSPRHRRSFSCSSASRSAQRLASKYKMRRRSSNKSPAAAVRERKTSERQHCIYYGRFGKCNRGDRCTYIHDPDKISICTRFLRGTCSVENCPFSHTVRRERMPTCRHFIVGVCLRGSACPYLHVNVGADAEICDDFIKGNCTQGEMCKKRHELLCPDFLKTGKCPRADKCIMKHWRRSNKTSSDRSSDNMATSSGSGDKKPIKRTVDGKPKTSGTLSEGLKTSLDKSKEDEADDVNLPWNMRRFPSYIAINSTPNQTSSDISSSTLETPESAYRRKVEDKIHPRLSYPEDLSLINEVIKSFLDTTDEDPDEVLILD